MTGYSTERWGDLFVCAGGASAALAGLIFVALSINIGRVLELEREHGQNFLTGRGLEALGALLVVLAISIVGLTPDIDRVVLAGFILLSAIGTGISPSRAIRAHGGQSRPHTKFYVRVNISFLLTLTLLLAGITLIAGHGGGLYWLPAAFVLAVVVSGMNAWVLLVEILR